MEADLSLERLVFNLNTLTELGEEITSPKDFTRVVRSSLFMVMGTFSASRGMILRKDPERKVFSVAASKGIAEENGFELLLSDGAQKEFVRYGKPVDLKGGEEIVTLFGPSREKLEKLGARVVSFLIVRDELLGIVAINEKFSGDDYTPYDMQLLSVMAQHIAQSLHSHTLLAKLMTKYSENRSLYQDLRRVYYETIHAFATAIDAKDAYTKGHSHRVSAYCAVLAGELGWPEDEIEGMRVAGLLHDIGKIAVDKSIINKASPLTSNECKELNSHPVVGYEILSKIKFPWKGIPFSTRNHHERVDGSGYPDRLERSQIPVGARVMALVDSFDAMTTDRPYRPRLSFKDAVKEFRENLGTQFDPDMVIPFLAVIKREVMGEVERPSVIPLLREHLEAFEVKRLIEDFPH